MRKIEGGQRVPAVQAPERPRRDLSALARGGYMDDDPAYAAACNFVSNHASHPVETGCKAFFLADDLAARAGDP